MSTITLDFLHGRPACGKNTQADLLVSDIPHSAKISGVYRSAFTQIGPYAKYHDLVAPYIKPLGQGIDMPGEIVVKMLADIINNGKRESITTFIICGLLRTIDHKRAIDILVRNDNELIPNHIYLSTTQGKVLKQKDSRHKKDTTNGEARLDDTDTLMQARLARYKTNTLPMLKELAHEGNLHLVRADRSINEIHDELKNLLASETHILESPQISLTMMRR